MEATDQQFFIFCQNIRYLRKTHRLTQKRMAEICGVSVSTLRKLEDNILPPKISVRTIFNISNHFGLLPGQLFSRQA